MVKYLAGEEGACVPPPTRFVCSPNEYAGKVCKEFKGNYAICAAALVAAAQGGHCDVVRFLLVEKLCGDADGANDDGNTALMFAAKSGHFEMVEHLVTSRPGASVHLRTGDLETAVVVWQRRRDASDVSPSMNVFDHAYKRCSASVAYI